MGGVEPRLQLADTHLVLVLEDISGADRAGGLQLLVLLQPGPECQGAARLEVEGDGDTVVTGGEELGASQPGEGQHGEEVRPQLHHHHVLAGVRHGDGAVVPHPGELTPVPRETDGVDPASSVLGVGELRHEVPHRHPVAPGGGGGLRLNLFDESGVDTDLEVSGAGRQKDVVGVPVETGDGGLERLLDVFCHPPVIVLLVVTDRDDLGTTSHSKLVLLWTPPDTEGYEEETGERLVLPDTGGRPVDPEQHQSIFPLTVRTLHPHVGIPVAGAGHDPVGVGGPVDPGHPEVVLVQDSSLGPAGPSSASGVEGDVLAVVGESQLSPGPGPGVAGDGRGSETVNCGHGEVCRGLWSVYTASFLGKYYLVSTPAPALQTTCYQVK